jgi:hydroxyacylglutathione hydrolase
MKNHFLNSLIFALMSIFVLTAIIFPDSQSRAQNQRDNTDTTILPSWLTVKLVADNVWRIDDHGGDNMYLVAGKDKALLIDTGTGVADLLSFVKSITSLPLLVVDTHGHPDHAGGNYQFKEIYAHPADLAMIEMYNNQEFHANTIERALLLTPLFESSVVKESGKFNPASVLPVQSGFTFDLGGRKLEIIETPGHTKGSICLLDAENKLLFAGDNDNSLVWLFLKDCLPLEVYLQSLQKLQQRNNEFNTIFPGHGEPLDKTFLDEQIICARNILDGECKGQPYHSFIGGDAWQCSYKRAGIAFNPENLRVKQ